MEMTMVTRQLLVNNILLPVDMLNVIKGFAFVDMVSHNSKCNKDIVNNVIKNALVSSFRDMLEDEEPYFGDIWDDPENDPWANLVDEHLVEGDFAWAEDEEQLFWDEYEDNELIWAFCATEDSNQFQAAFCRNCGNYITEHLQIPYSDKIICKCIVL